MSKRILLLGPVLMVAALGVMRGQAAEPNKRTNSTVTTASKDKGYKDVNVEQFDKLRANTNNIILDVRTPEEFAAGHIAGAKNIDINTPDFEKKITELDKSKTYLVHCAAGGRSARACNKMSKLDFTNCYNLVGGMHAWERAGKPVEKAGGAK